MRLAITILLFLPLLVPAQSDSSLKLSPVIYTHLAIRDFTTDNLGNIYLVYNTNRVKKINGKGDSIAVYNDVKRYGDVACVDASNPLKVLVFYKDFLTIVVLDRLLNVRNTIDLRESNILQASAITNSYDNKIWLFDELDSKIKKIDERGTVVMESADFRQVFNPVPQPIKLLDHDGQLYLYDSLRGFLIFDYYGAQKSIISLPHTKDIVLGSGIITGRNARGIFLYKPSTFQTWSFELIAEVNSYVKVSFNGNKLYTLSKSGEFNIFNVLVR